MRNKWFVGGILLPAVVCTWGAIACLRGDSAYLGVVPAALAAGLFYAAYRVSQAPSFSPEAPMRWDSGTSNAVKQWNTERDAREARDVAAKKAPPKA